MTRKTKYQPPKQHPVVMSITYPSGGRADEVRIEIGDVFSRTSFLQIRTTYANFAQALATRSDQPCYAELRGLDLIGKTHESKRESIDVTAFVNRYGDDFTERLVEAVKPLEVDGWRARIENGVNQHRRTRVGKIEWYEVTFFRCVDTTPEKAAEVNAEHAERYRPTDNALREIKRLIMTGSKQDLREAVRQIDFELSEH